MNHRAFGTSLLYWVDFISIPHAISSDISFLSKTKLEKTETMLWILVTCHKTNNYWDVIFQIQLQNIFGHLMNTIMDYLHTFAITRREIFTCWSVGFFSFRIILAALVISLLISISRDPTKDGWMRPSVY